MSVNQSCFRSASIARCPDDVESTEHSHQQECCLCILESLRELVACLKQHQAS